MERYISFFYLNSRSASITLIEMSNYKKIKEITYTERYPSTKVYTFKKENI